MSVRVGLGAAGYEVVVRPGALGEIGSLLERCARRGARRVYIVHDAGVPREHLGTIGAGARDCALEAHADTLDPSESVKTLDTYRDLLVSMIERGHTRADPVVALGGGIVGDLAGFVAAGAMRGVPVIQCPTTLLAMVDASVGGKTGVNLAVPGASGAPALLKNMVGAFHQPIGVLADIDTLVSLGERQRRAGLAECAKHAHIAHAAGSDDLLGWTIANLDAIRSFDPGVITELVRRNVALKARVVERDERERADAPGGGRMLLNFGHTFAHAIETIAHLSPDLDDASRAPLLHGEAVALGMVAAAAASRSMGIADRAVVSGVMDLNASLGLPVRVRDLPPASELIARMRHDKKARAGVIRLVLPTGPGVCRVVDDADEDAIAAGLDAIRA